MPDLNLREIQYRLEIQKKILLERLQNQGETAESDEGINPDQSDLAGRYRRQNPDTQLPVRARQQLAEVERALERLIDGSYGKCTLCEQPIQSEHLELIPAATLCIQCQEQKKQQQNEELYMSDGILRYDIGHWVVHSWYGIGQIKQIENISLHGGAGAKQRCFQVQTRLGTFWFPIEQHNNPRVRPVITKKKLISSLKILKEPPEDLDVHHNELRVRINNAQTDVSIKTTLRLIRDLSARKATKKLNYHEGRALELHKERLIREWAFCMEMDETEARIEFDRLVQERKQLPA